MTRKRDLKKRVRERQTRTGERYTTALQEVQSRRGVGPSSREPMSVIELLDFSEQAARLGLKCEVSIFPDLAERVDGAAALERLRDVLIATADDPATEPLRAVMLRGEWPALLVQSVFDLTSDGRRFMSRARAGIGGVSESGRMLAISIAGRQGPEMVVCLLWHWLWVGQAPLLQPVLLRREPRVILAGPMTLFPGVESLLQRVP